MQKLYVIKKRAECPCCHTELEVVTPKGYGSTPQGDKKIRKITRGIKLEILHAYIQDPYKSHTTRDIINRINFVRYQKGLKKLERSNLTRPHSELVDAQIISIRYKKDYDYYYVIDEKKAKALLDGEKF
jgi:hypothetical protein